MKENENHKNNKRLIRVEIKFFYSCFLFDLQFFIAASHSNQIRKERKGNQPTNKQKSSKKAFE